MKNIILRAFKGKVLGLAALGASSGLALADTSCTMPPLIHATDSKLTPCNPTSTLHCLTSCDQSAWITVTDWTFVSSSLNCTLYVWPADNSLCSVTRSDNSPIGTVIVQATGLYYHYSSQYGLLRDAFNVTNSLEIADSGDEGSGGFCPKCASPTGGTLGTAVMKSEARPKVSFNLGIFSQPQSAGVLALDAYNASVPLYNPGALYVPYVRSNTSASVDVVTNASGAVQQVNAPQGLINVAVVSAYRYDLQMFDSSKVAGKVGGVYVTNGPAFAVWSVQNPDGGSATNRLTVAQILTNSPAQQFTYTYTNDSGTIKCQLSDSNALQTVVSWEAQDPNDGTLTNHFELTKAGNTVLRSVEKTYQVINYARALVRQIDGTGTATNVTAYTINSSLSNNPPQRIDYPNGNWEYFEYDDNGRVTTKYSAYGNSAPPAMGSAPEPSTCKMVQYTYAYYNGPVPGDDQYYHPEIPRQEVVSLPSAGGSTEVSRLYRSAPAPDEIDEYVCPTPGASYDDPSNLVTRKVIYSDPNDLNTFGRTGWIILPDGTASIYAYITNSSGLLTNIVLWQGVPSDTVGPTNVVEGTQTKMLLDSLGRITNQVTTYVSNSVLTAVLSRLTYYYSSNPSIRDYQVADLAGLTNQFYYACCGLSTTIDPDGVITSYDYDSLKRQVATTTQHGGTGGVKLTNILDAANQVLVTQRIGTNGSPITLNQYQFDVLGRIMRETNALNGVTTHTNVLLNSQVCITNVNPDGGTRVEVYYRDGRLQSVSGTAVSPLQYQYGADQDDGTWREFTLEIKLDATGGTNEWTKTYVDGAGQRYKTVYAGATGNPVALTSYNSGGQVANQVDPDGISMLYAYNGKGERVLSVVDSNQNYTIDYTGGDRITFTTNDVASDHGSNVRRTQVYVWSTSSNSSNLISTVEASTDGLKSWNTLWSSGTAVTRQSSTAYSSNGNRYVTNTAPDNSYTMSLYQYGLLASVTSYDANNNQIGKTSYGYDNHFRQNTVTDGRTGTTTYSFNNADQVSSITTPSPTEVTTYYFDTMGRTIATTLPDNTSVTNVFWPTGLPKLTYGSRAYPVGYNYDAQGRMTKMTNWTSFSGGSGARVTTWNYDQCRGWLTNKTYADTSKVFYSNTSAGRLAQRLWARGTNTVYSYNGAGDLSGITYSAGAANVTYAYDRRGRQTSVTQGSITTTRAYDDAGNLLAEACSGGPLGGLAVTNAFDSLLRRRAVALSNQTSTLVQFGYDAASRLQSVTNGTATATYSYLANSPLVSQIGLANNGSQLIAVSKSYDNLNRMTSVSAGSAVNFNYGYNPANQRTAMTNADNTYWAYGYDSLGQVTSGAKRWSDGTLQAGEQFQYAFDDIGNRKTTAAGGDQWGANLRYANYTVNNVNQYTSRTVPGAVDVIGTANSNATVTVNNQPASRKGTYYDVPVVLNNLTNAVWASLTNLAVLNNGTNLDITTNFAANAFLPQTPESFSYDADGNLSQDGRWQYTWDAENRLISLQGLSSLPTAAKLKLDFVYDDQGRRIQKAVSLWTNSAWSLVLSNRFVYDEWNLVAELNATNNNLIRSYVWGLDLSGTTQGAGGVGGLLEIKDAVYGVQFAAFDANGNVAALVKATDGTASAQYEYGPFGEVIRATGPMAKANPFRFSTKYQDDEADLLYYGYRYYNPSTGRWLSRDPKGPRGGLNLYGFAASDAVNRYDLLGLMTAIDVDTYYEARKQAIDAANIMCSCRCGKREAIHEYYIIGGTRGFLTVTAATLWQDCSGSSANTCCGPFNSTYFWWDCYTSAEEGGKFPGDMDYGWSWGGDSYAKTAVPSWSAPIAVIFGGDPYHIAVDSQVIYEQCVNGKLQTQKNMASDHLVWTWSIWQRWTGPVINQQP